MTRTWGQGYIYLQHNWDQWAGGVETSVSAKSPDFARFSPIRADSSPIFYACHPKVHASVPKASDFAAKLNDPRFTHV
jgi:hypothetical protein